MKTGFDYVMERQMKLLYFTMTNNKKERERELARQFLSELIWALGKKEFMGVCAQPPQNIPNCNDPSRIYPANTNSLLKNKNREILK